MKRRPRIACPHCGAVYVLERGKEGDPEQAVDEPEADAGPAVIRPRTDAWWALFWRRLHAGENVLAMLGAARGDTGYPCMPAAMPTREEIDTLVDIETGSLQFLAWAAWLLEKGLRLQGGQACGRFIRVPSDYPPGHDESEGKT